MYLICILIFLCFIYYGFIKYYIIEQLFIANTDIYDVKSSNIYNKYIRNNIIDINNNIY